MHNKTVTCLFFLCSVLTRSIAFAQAPQTPSEKAKPVVSVEKVEMKPLSDEVTYPARAVTRINAIVQSEIDGVVVDILQPLGKSVSSGEALIKIKNSDPVYEYVPVAVSSPIRGIVSNLEVSIGSMVRKGQNLMTITDPSQLRLAIEVAAADLPFVQIGLKGEFSSGLSGNRENLQQVEVTGVSPMLDPGTGTATAELKPTKTSGSSRSPLIIGAVGRVMFHIHSRQAIEVPEQALVYRGNETLIRLVVDNKIKFSPVKIAGTRRGNAEISEGLKHNDIIVVRSSTFVTGGQEVTIQQGGVATK